MQEIIMGKKEFEALLSKHETIKSESQIDWNIQKEEWLGFLQSFYVSVEKWLKPYVDQDKLQFNYVNINLTEENIGTYDVKSMHILFSEQLIKLEPIGTLLIGTKGRIDMEGARGSVQFILVDKESKGVKVNVYMGGIPQTKEEPKEPDWTWKIVLRESRRIAYDEFSEDNFFNALMEVING
jgi:hypothetical protein